MGDEGVVFLEFGYDIPSGNGFPNPSPYVRFFAVRDQLSSWVMRTSSFPLIERFLRLIDQFNDKQENPDMRVRYRLRPYHNMSEEEIKNDAVQALEKEAASIHGRLIKSLDDATKVFDKAYKEAEEADGHVTLKNREKFTLDKVRKSKAALVRSQKALNAAVSAAEQFDRTMEASVLLDGLRETIKSQNEAFNAWLGQYVESGFGLVVA